MVTGAYLIESSNCFSLLKNVENTVPIVISQNFRNLEYSLIVTPRDLLLSLRILKDHIGLQYRVLSCISGVDLFKKSYRFLVSYDLLSLVFNSRIRVKLFIDECTIIPSSVEVYINANWWEREIWDLYGVFFYNHPDLRRILTDYGFEGYPLRKDFPLSGFYELHYDINSKMVVSTPNSLSQEFRCFSYEMPW